MDVKSWLQKIGAFSKQEDTYAVSPDDEGLNFSTTAELAKKIKKGEAPSLITHQHIALTMLEEQGDAEKIPNGFILPTEHAVRLDEYSRSLLRLAPQWQRRLRADIRGHSANSQFSVALEVETPRGDFSRHYTLTGPILAFTPSQQYLLTAAQQWVFGAHQTHADSAKTEYDNLKLLLALQQARSKGAAIDLGHFNKLDIKAPDSIAIEAELDDSGNLILTPFVGQNASHDKMNRVLGQLQSEQAKALRVDDEIILFDEQKLKAVHEILENRRIPRSQVKAFRENPTAFIDANLVDLDLGFSARVKGATVFKHAYFGETDGSGVDWFAQSAAPGRVAPFSQVIERVKDKESWQELKSTVDNARKTGANAFDFREKSYLVPDIQEAGTVFEKIERKLAGSLREDEASEAAPASEEEDRADSSPAGSEDVSVVNVALNDEELEISSPTVAAAISEVLYPSNALDWHNYARQPFAHQLIGVQWILGLVHKNQKGGLLADDMGLGKTFMALSSIDHLYKRQSETGVRKPALIVAPLSLLENWKDEVDKTFNQSPFTSIVTLQADADLPGYRVGAVEIRNQELTHEGEAEIRYSLKVGKNFGAARLDMPERLVITTYQTLRDYQFSLCTVDWGMVVFDEAQNIKNPNTLQTRAAKGLKADFKLLATGTPVENSLQDFWCLVDTCCPGHLDSYQNFRRTYISPVTHAAGDEVEEVRSRIGRDLRLKVGSLMLRRLKEDNLEGLPDKHIFVGIPGDQWGYADSLDRTMGAHQLESYNAVVSTGAGSQGPDVLGCLHQLRDVSLHPRLADGGRLDVPDNKKALQALFSESAKMEALLDVLEQIQVKKEKCIIFAVNKRLQQFLSLALGRWFKLGPLSIINGDAKAVAKGTSVPTRKSMIADFEARAGFNIIVMSPIAAGVGLTVVGANHVIHFERHWNPAKEAQATDRVYRIGQTKDVSIYIPVLHHPEFESFDANLHKLLSRKTSLKDAVVTPEQVVPNPEGFGEHVLMPEHVIREPDLAKISWQQFEALCALLLARKVEASDKWLTQAGTDYGADAVVWNGDSGYLVQCKHTRSNSFDGHKAIREVYSARIRYEKALNRRFEHLVFMTNASKLSARTRDIAREYSVEVMDCAGVSQLLRQHSVTFKQTLSLMKTERLAVG